MGVFCYLNFGIRVRTYEEVGSTTSESRTEVRRSVQGAQPKTDERSGTSIAKQCRGQSYSPDQLYNIVCVYLLCYFFIQNNLIIFFNEIPFIFDNYRQNFLKPWRLPV